MKTTLLILALTFGLAGFAGCCSPCWNCCDRSCIGTDACHVAATSTAGEYANGPVAPGIPMR